MIVIAPSSCQKAPPGEQLPNETVTAMLEAT